MGGQKSQEYASLVQPLQPSQFLRLEDRGEYQLWEDRVSTRRFMVFTVNPREALTEHNLQIYHFRKLNRAYLVGVHGIYREQEALCSHQQRTLLMLEHLPHSLADLASSLSAKDGMVILQAAFAGYRILSYIFGPLLPSAETILFTEAGVPKIWSNRHLDLNEPAKETMGEDQRERELFKNLSIAEKKALSMRRILAVVSNSLRNPLPSELLGRLNHAKSYEEGQQALEFYCRSTGLELQDWINIRPTSSVSKSPLISPSIESQSFLKKVSSANPQQENAFNRTLSIRNQNIQHFHKIQGEEKTKVAMPLTLVEPRQPVQRSFCIKIPSIRSSIQHQNITPHQVITQTIITPAQSINSHPLIHHQIHHQQVVKKDNRVSVQMLTPVTPAEAENKEIQAINSSPQEQVQSSPSRQQHQTNPEQDDYQLIVHDLTNQPSGTVQMSQAQSNQLAASDQFHKQAAQIQWQQNPQIINRFSKQSSDNYRSQERDQVIISQHRDIQDFKSQEELERYIREKYSDYFNSQEPPKLTHHHTSSLDRKVFEKKVAFAEPSYERPEQEEEEEFSSQRLPTGKFGLRSDENGKKYTFGNIDFQQNHSNDRLKKRQKANESLDQRYSKYVLNRLPKQPQPQPQSFSQPQQPSQGLEQDFRKLLNR